MKLTTTSVMKVMQDSRKMKGWFTDVHDQHEVEATVTTFRVL